MISVAIGAMSKGPIDAMKVPIETLPVELRIKIYEFGDVSTTKQKAYYLVFFVIFGDNRDQ
jgi:hypothetical protein